MDELVFFGAMEEGLWIAVKISTPILLAALIVGFVIGLLQALTSIQEMTLTFVPKMAAILAAFWASMGFMTLSLTGYFEGTLLPLIMGM
jgi:flagellar biosynthetic protein FliQ